MIKRILKIIACIVILIFAPGYIGQLQVVKNVICPLFIAPEDVPVYIIGLVALLLSAVVVLCMISLFFYLKGNK